MQFLMQKRRIDVESIKQWILFNFSLRYRRNLNENSSNVLKINGSFSTSDFSKFNQSRMKIAWNAKNMNWLHFKECSIGFSKCKLLNFSSFLLTFHNRLVLLRNWQWMNKNENSREEKFAKHHKTSKTSPFKRHWTGNVEKWCWIFWLLKN